MTDSKGIPSIIFLSEEQVRAMMTVRFSRFLDYAQLIENVVLGNPGNQVISVPYDQYVESGEVIFQMIWFAKNLMSRVGIKGKINVRPIPDPSFEDGDGSEISEVNLVRFGSRDIVAIGFKINYK